MTNQLQNFSPPEMLNFTLFESHNNPIGAFKQLKYRDFQFYLSDPVHIKQSKPDQALIKLAYFENNQRSNHNLQFLYGVEGDYDAGKHSPEQVISTLNTMGIEAVVCTTASHTPEKPRFRIFCPFSEPQHPRHHEHYVILIDGFLGNILAKESYTASQSYYIGSVAQGHPVEVYHSSGVCIDAFPPCPSETRHQNLTGHSEKKRARGSTVIKGALDAEYLVEKTGEQIKFTCTKMKDTAEPKPKNFILKEQIVNIGNFPEQCAVLDVNELYTPSLSPQETKALNIILEAHEKITYHAFETALINSGATDAKPENLKRISKRLVDSLKEKNELSEHFEFLEAPDNTDNERTQ